MNYQLIKIVMTEDEYLALCADGNSNLRKPADQAHHILRAALRKEKPAKLEHITAPPTVEDFNMLIDCINAARELG